MKSIYAALVMIARVGWLIFGLAVSLYFALLFVRWIFE